MKKYEIYNKTNSNFIPEIPLNWKKLRVKNLVDNNTYYPVGDGDHGSIKPEMYLEEGVPYIRVQNLSWTGELLLDNVVYISEEVQKANAKSILRPGDILIAKTGATVGKLGLIPKELKEANTTSSVGKLTIDLSRFNPKYILYSFQAKHFNDQIWMQASQKSAQPGFNIDDLIEFEIASPELEEQTAIATFLDYKTNLIDATIEKKKCLIELLKEKRQAVINEAVTKGLNSNAPMKNSGVEWLGEIPEHWKVKKLKHIKSNKPNAFVDGPFGSNLKTEHFIENGEVYVIESGFITSGNFEYKREFKTISLNHFDTISRSECNEDDIILAKIGANYGMSAILPQLDKKSVVSGNSLKLTVDTCNNDLKFIHLFLLFLKQSGSFELIVNESAQPALSLGSLNNISISIPKKEEQIEIRVHIEKNNSIIDKLIIKIEENIQKLQIYRQSLISEAVTGKIDVRDWKITKN
jgi:type I restriction enzyme S subunit